MRTDAYYNKYNKLLNNVCQAVNNSPNSQKITYVSIVRELEPLRFFQDRGIHISKRLWARAKKYLVDNFSELGKKITIQVGRKTKVTSDLLSGLKTFLKRREISRVSPNRTRHDKKIRYLNFSIETTFTKFVNDPNTQSNIKETLFRQVMKNHFPQVCFLFVNYSIKNLPRELMSALYAVMVQFMLKNIKN